MGIINEASDALIAQVRRDAAEYGEDVVPKGLIGR